MKYIFQFLVLVLLGCQKGPTTPDITGGLVVNILFDDGSPVESVSGVSGVIHRATPTSDRKGKASQAMLFSAYDSSTIDFGDLPLASVDSNGLFTICCWIKVVDTAGNFALLSKRGLTGPWEYCIDNFFSHNRFVLDNWIDNGSTSVYGIDPLQASAPITIGQWQHLAYVADGNQLRVYVNGVIQSGIDRHSSGLSFSKTSTSLVIGNGGGYGRNFYFSGAIDDIKMYNRALSQSAVKYLAGL